MLSKKEGKQLWGRVLLLTFIITLSAVLPALAASKTQFEWSTAGAGYTLAVDQLGNSVTDCAYNSQIGICQIDVSGVPTWHATSAANTNSSLYLACDNSSNCYYVSTTSQTYPYQSTVYKVSPTGVQQIVDTFTGVGNAVTVDKSNNVYISIGSSVISVRKYSSAGALLSTQPIFVEDEMAVDSAGNIYGVSRTDSMIRKYDYSGSVIWSVNVYSYNGLKVDSADNVYFTDYNNALVYKYNSAGALQWSATTDAGPREVDVDSQGNVYVATYSASTFQKFNSSGQLQWTVPLASGRSRRIKVDPNQNIYVISGGAVVKYSQYCNSPRLFPATNPSVTPGISKISGSDFINLMANTNYLREEAHLGACSWHIGGNVGPGSIGGSGVSGPRNDYKIYAQDVNDVRACLAEVYTTCDGSCGTAGGCSSWNVTAAAGTTKIMATDINDLVTGINAAP